MTDKSTANYPIVVVDVDDDTTDGENDEVSTIVRTRIDTASPTTSPIRPHTPLEEAVHGGLRLTRTRRTYHETAAPPSSPVTASSPPSTPLSFTAQAPKKRKAPVVHEPYSAAANMRAAMELAKYELLVDPYRGMTKLRDAHHDEERDETDTNGHVATSPSLATVEITPRPSPWQTSCAVAIPESGDCRSPTDDGDDIANWEAADIVKRACNCSCPSLTSWTSALAVARDKKRKKSKHQRKANSTVNTHVLDGDTVRIGQRPDGHAVRCPCDYNPFCLVSLGGVVNEILVDRYKELETKNDRAGNGEVEEVVDDSSVTNDAEGPVQPNRIISDATQEDMNAVRRSISVRVEPIRSYLEHTLQDLTPALTLEDCISRIRKRHAALIFVNPLLKEKADSPKDNDALVMSIPPGMQNLGATCYLNTQLQCLAQNLVFLEGVLSWRPPTSTVDGNANPDPIPQMIETFQSLLASMRIGPHYVLNTKDFSNALRLDHYEQQDPNEFSRLLLDCIQQSFQSATQQRDLATLLPHLFHGKTTYTTTCQVCHKMSTTTENFMDVTLPIVKPLREKSMPGQQSLADAFGKSKAKKNLQSYDTDVQYCWDRYVYAETLEGDNQYFCTECEAKVDAQRALTFSALPPVLNIQLCRYVYDRNRGTKKKVTDKVLLPTELEIEQATTSAPSTSPQVETEPTKHRYVLCAVMLHKGNSAYSGHYVAEAMDWQTGQWFEFNDAHVTLLEAPSCSWDPLFDSDRSDDRKKDTKETKAKKGSEDAYNMYYVEESFLAQSVLDSIREIDPQTGASKSESEDGASALKTAALTRSEYFADLRRMCLQDGQVAIRLQDRRRKIRTCIFPTLASYQIGFHKREDFVWVDALSLRRYMSCDYLRKDEYGNAKKIPFFQHGRFFFCGHQSDRGVHPVIARRGKLLPRPIYDALLQGLAAERPTLFCDTKYGVREISDCPGIPAERLYCSTCSKSYCQELSETVQLCEKILFLYERLDPKEGDFEDDSKGDNIAASREIHGYIVSRRFVSRFRNRAARLFKSFDSLHDTTISGPIHKTSKKCESFAEGFHSVRAREVMFENTDSKSDDDLDIFINSNITCDHLICNASSKRSIRVVSPHVWRVLVEMFPQAIEHKILLNDTSNCNFACEQCHEQGVSSDSFRTRLHELASYCRREQAVTSIVLKDLLDEQSLLSEIELFRIVPKDELQGWHKFMSSFSRKEDRRDTQTIQEGIAELFSSGRQPISSSFLTPALLLGTNSLDVVGKRCLLELSRILRPLVCSEHQLLIEAACFCKPSRDSFRKLPTLSHNVVVLNDKEYKKYMNGLIALSYILQSEGDGDHTPAETLFSESTTRYQEYGLYRWHPVFQTSYFLAKDKGRLPSRFIISTDKVSMSFGLRAVCCVDKDCQSKYTEWESDEREDKMGIRDKASEKESHHVCSGDATHPISLDSDDDRLPDTVFVRVFDVEENALFESITRSLSQCTELPSPEEEVGLQVRRSTRKRHGRYPLGVIKAEDRIRVNVTSNVAALRLLLFEQCSNGCAFELNHRLQAIVSPRRDTSASLPVESVSAIPVEGVVRSKTSTHVIDLGLDVSEKTLLELCERVSDGKLSDPRDDLVLIRQSVQDESSADLPKDALMDVFIGLANTNNEDNEAVVSKTGKRKRSVERGFTGTLLTSKLATIESTKGNGSKSDSENLSAPIASSSSPPTSALTTEQDNHGPDIASQVDSDINAASNSTVSVLSEAVIESTVALTPGGLDTSKEKSIAFKTSVSPATTHAFAAETHPVKSVVDVPSKLANTRLVDMLESDDEDDCRELGQLKRTRSVSLAETEEQRAELTMQLCAALIDNPNVNETHEGACWDAANWAVAKYPKKLVVTDLVDDAFAKYFELTCRD